MVRQLPLDLPHRASLTRDDFLVGAANREALATVDAWPDWPVRLVVLAGPAGSGKTHLAEIWRSRADAVVLTTAGLAGAEPDEILARGSAVVEDLHAGPLDETALFHLLNRAKETGAFVVMTSRVWPAALNVGLADLASRLAAARPVELGEPDDDLLRNVLAKLFADRQLSVTPPVVEFIVRRMERSLETARSIVAELDARALAEGRAVTRHLAGSVLEDVANL